jgi:hypothetical protein
MSFVNWDKPKKVHSTKEHNKMNSSDSGVAGTYVPNMSEENAYDWKGKIINRGKENVRAELRKTFSGDGHYAQVLIVINNEGLKMSANGSIQMTHIEHNQMNSAINEAKMLIRIVK